MSTLPEEPVQVPSNATADIAPTADIAESAETSAPPAPTDAAADPAATPAADTAQTGAMLAERFPALFKGAPKPLKLRIQADIQERAPGVFTKAQLSAFLRRHTGATSYLVAVTRAPHRFDLDGQPAGELTDEHREVAQTELQRRRERRQAKEQADQQAQAAELQARRQRAQLLRDHSLTKLTTANFCALKGIAPEQLDALLAQARTEAEEDARNPRAPHGGPGRRDGDGRGRGDGRGGPQGEGRRDARGPRGEGRGPGRGDGRGDGRNDGRGRPQGRPGPSRNDGRSAGPRDGRPTGGQGGHRGQGGQGGDRSAARPPRQPGPQGQAAQAPQADAAPATPVADAPKPETKA